MNVWETCLYSQVLATQNNTTPCIAGNQTQSEGKGVSTYGKFSSLFEFMISFSSVAYSFYLAIMSWLRLLGLIYNFCRSNMPPLLQPFANIHLVLLNNLGCLWSCVHWCTTSTKNQLVWTFSNGSIRVESTHISGLWASLGPIQQNLVKPYIQLWIRNDVWHYILSWHNVVKTLIKHTIFDGWNPTHLLKWWIWERLIIVLICFNHINAFEASFPLPFFSSPDLFCIEVSCLPKRLGLRGCP